MTLPKEHRDKILPGRRVRVAKGAAITSDHPTQPEKTPARPYWVIIDRLEGDTVVWLGSGNYANRTSKDNIDQIEDLA